MGREGGFRAAAGFRGLNVCVPIKALGRSAVRDQAAALADKVIVDVLSLAGVLK